MYPLHRHMGTATASDSYNSPTSFYSPNFSQSSYTHSPSTPTTGVGSLATNTSQQHQQAASAFYFGSPQQQSHPQIPTSSVNTPQCSSTGGGGAQFTLIANVPYDTVRQDLVVEFRKYGRVELAMVVCDEASRHPHKEWTSTAGYAFVRFSQRQEAAAAIQAASLGLITIRGTRVRADWARKDSYAKRGRVSPTQGAPLLGPLGVPDGIEQLRQFSLMEQQGQTPLNRRSMPHFSESGTSPGRSQQPRNLTRTRTSTDSLKFLYSSGGRSSTAGSLADSTPTPTHQQQRPQQLNGIPTDPTQRSDQSPNNREILQALQDAFGHILSTRTPPEDPRGLHTAPSTPQLYCHDDSSRSKMTHLLPRNQSLTLSDNTDRHEDQSTDKQTTPCSIAAQQRPIYDYSCSKSNEYSAPILPRECWLMDSPTSGDPALASDAFKSPLSTSRVRRGNDSALRTFDEVLSPVSAGLLAQALSDVVGAFDVTSSPTEALTQTTVCSSSAAQRNPEELLQRAVHRMPSSSKIEPGDPPANGPTDSGCADTQQHTPLMIPSGSLSSSGDSKPSAFFPPLSAAGWTDEDSSCGKKCDYPLEGISSDTPTWSGSPPHSMGS